MCSVQLCAVAEAEITTPGLSFNLGILQYRHTCNIGLPAAIGIPAVIVIGIAAVIGLAEEF